MRRFKVLFLIFARVFCQVEVEGLKSLRIEDIQAYIPQTSVEQKIQESLRLLAKTGWFKRLEYYKSSEGKFILVVEEKELVKDFNIKGAKDGDKLLEELAQYRLKEYSDSLSQSVKETVLKFLDSRGYPDASVSLDRSTETGVVTVNVEQGNRVKIEDVSVEVSGKQALDKKTDRGVRDLLKTTPYRWWSSWLTGTGYLSRSLLEEDSNRIREYLKLRGYFDASVQHVESFENGRARVRFLIEPGSRYKLGSITSSAEIEVKGFKSGEFFDGSELRSFLDAELTKIKDQGYAFANLIPNFNLKQDAKVVDVNIVVEKGEKQTIREIKIEGNSKTRDYVIRRDLRIFEGDIFNLSKLERSKRRLLRTGYFKDVKYETFRVPGTTDSVDVSFSVTETQTGSLSLGAGYSTLDSFFANLKVSERNVLGTGLGAYFSGYLGTEFNSFNLRIVEPRLFNSFYSAALDLFRNRRDFDDFKRYQTGGKITLGYDFEEFDALKDFSARVFADIREVEIDDVKSGAATFIKESAGKGQSRSVGFEIRRFALDRAIRPTTGSTQSLTFEYGGLGGDFDFYVFGISNSLVRSVLELDEGGKIVFVNKTSFDYGKGLNGQRFPLFKRFFPGGSRSVRGYKPRSMGPKEGDSEYGGAKQIINNTELVVPIADEIGLDLVGFFDIGEAFDDSENVDISDLRKAYGAGIRWNSPIGPISLEFGFPLDKREGDKSFVVNFSAGTEF